MNRSFRWILVLVAGALCLTLTVVRAQQQAGAAPPQGRAQQTPPAPTGPLAPEKYKDIKVLTDVAADQLDVTMRYFVASTGIQCQGCHVRDQATGEFHYEQDQRGKTTARLMINLVKTVNAGDFGGRVNCGTCHAGRNQPAGLQPALVMTPEQLAQLAAQAAARQGGPGGAGGPGGPGGDRGAPPPGAQGAQAGQRGAAPPPGAAGAPPQQGGQPGGRGQQTPPPPVDDVIGKFLDGMGGRAAIEKLQSRVITGTLTNRSAQSIAFTIEETGTRYRESLQAQPAATTLGFDGTTGWAQVGDRVSEIAGFPLQQILRSADLTLPIRLKEKYPNLVAGRPTRLPSATPGAPATDVNILQGSPVPYTTETLSIDATSGVLLRRRVVTSTALRGSLVEQYDYSDYRVVNGVKMPFEIKRTTWNTVDTLKVSDIKVNTTIADARFAKPKG
jgi:hypothetical protein